MARSITQKNEIKSEEEYTQEIGLKEIFYITARRSNE